MRKISIQDHDALGEVLAVIERGGVVIVPTDTVYGIGCDSGRRDGIERLFAIKKRDPEKAVAMLFLDVEMVERYAHIPPSAKDALKSLWPGALTAVFRSKERESETVGARVPNDTFVLELIRRLRRPLAMTSANISGRPAHTRIADVLSDFQGEKSIDLVIDGGDLPEGRASTVVDFTVSPPHIIREGPIERAHIEHLFQAF